MSIITLIQIQILIKNYEVQEIRINCFQCEIFQGRYSTTTTVSLLIVFIHYLMSMMNQSLENKKKKKSGLLGKLQGLFVSQPAVYPL